MMGQTRPPTTSTNGGEGNPSPRTVTESIAAVLNETEVVAVVATPEPRGHPAQVAATAAAERRKLLAQLEPEIPDLVAAVRAEWVSFDQFIHASEGMDDRTNPKRHAFRLIYPLVRAAFEKSHGRIIDVHLSPDIRASAAITMPPGKTTVISRDHHKPGFHFLFDMALAPLASNLYARITQLACDASRILPDGALKECLHQLYSTTTDLLRIVEGHGSDAPAVVQERLVVVKRDLDRIEQRYLQVSARLLYFTGVIVGTGAAIIAALLIGANSGVDSVWLTTIMFAAAGAMLSVVQKIADGTLTVRYVVGRFYLLMLGFVRPLIGAAAGFLLQLAMTAGIIPLSISGAGGKAYVLLAGFAVGFGERSIPDIFSRAGLSSGLPPASGTSVAAPDGQRRSSGGSARNRKKRKG